MEKRGATLLTVCLVLALVLGQSTASCFSSCMFKCGFRHIFTDCIAQCKQHCKKPTSLDNPRDLQYYWMLGCASSCSNISTKENPGEDKVHDCLESCSKKCIYILPPM